MSVPTAPATLTREGAREVWTRWRSDSLYRNSVALMLNTAVGSLLGAAFMVVATRTFAGSQVGLLTTSVSASVLLATVATLGLPNALVRFLPARPQAASSIVTTSASLCLLTGAAAFAVSRYTAIGMPVSRPGRPVVLVALAAGVLLVLMTTMLLDAVFIARRSAHVLVVKNAVGGVTKVGCLLALSHRGTGDGGVGRLVTAHLVGTAVGLAVALVWLVRTSPGPWRPSLESMRGTWSFSLLNNLAMVAGSLPMTATPILVLDVLGAPTAAFFSVDLMVLALVHVVPQTVSVSFFAELSQGSTVAGDSLRRAVRGMYGLLVPAVAVAFLAAPLVLEVFGAPYRHAGLACLRWMIAGALIAAANYVVDAAVNGRGDGAGYLFLNVSNALFVLVGVWLGARVDLTHAGIGWVGAQALSCVLGLVYLRRGRRGAPGR